MKCPVCGKYDFQKYDDYNICKICGFENDGLQYDDHNYAGGANDLSVNEMRIEYFLQNYSASKEKAKQIYDMYSAERREIYSRYKNLDRVNDRTEAEAETKDFKNARQKYMNALNELLKNIIDDNAKASRK